MAALSAAEAAVYDRQLRVWGIEVQKRCAVVACCYYGAVDQSAGLGNELTASCATD